MKQERIAEILLRHSVVTEDQIEQALMRQKSRGGRLGTHLLYLKALTEKQLVQALAEQHGIPGVVLRGLEIPQEVTRRLPLGLVEENLILPFRYDADTNTLCVAVAHPQNEAALTRARRTAHGVDIKVHVAAEIVLRDQIARHYRGRDHGVLDQIIELPTIFAEEGEEGVQTAVSESETHSGNPRVLMVSHIAFLRNFLVSIFEREGIHLEVLSDAEEIAHSMRQGAVKQILVDQDMEDQFVSWVRSGLLPTPRTEISVFTTISAALLENPAPYNAMARPLLGCLQQLATHRCAVSTWKPPYTRICDDLQRTAGALGFRRLAADGLLIAAHLLVPSAKPLPQSGSGRFVPEALSFGEFEESLEIARSLQFPWDVESCLHSFANLVEGAAPGDRTRDSSHKVSLAAQILAVVWYRYSAFRHAELPVATLGAELHRQASHLAARGVIETYVRLLVKQAGKAGTTTPERVLIVSHEDEITKQLTSHLKSEGYSVVLVEEPAEAARLQGRSHFGAILISHDRFGDRALELCRFVQANSTALVYALSRDGDSMLVRLLLETGFNDVFVPPFNCEILVSRIGRALEIRGQHEEAARRQPSIQGTLAQLSFVDLIQALTGSQRTLRVKLEHPSGLRASVYLRQGQMVHATCGEVSGNDAVYRIIGWRDQGSFTTEPITCLPPENITVANHSLLLEGCRLLDERSAQASAPPAPSHAPEASRDLARDPS
ncbi:MAG: DUF4388 domain-containing protein [Candidatus Krumholzibacteriia bacterium]